ncbi:hypothetical protein QBC43DRAFT_361342 [Cladorrhinum sp. PSN259]|nr:hypothetical protein QBC43DRAFT_361342 [Cladorrhinum sp. PSN259]
MSLELSLMSTDDKHRWIGELGQDAEHIFNLTDYIFNSPDKYFLQVKDVSNNGERIATTAWSIFRESCTEAELQRRLKRTFDYMWAVRSPIGARIAAELLGMRQAIIGTDPHVLLEDLDVHEQHMGRGAGRMLVEWGTARADIWGFQAYLEASEEQIGFYERFFNFQYPVPDSVLLAE